MNGDGDKKLADYEAREEVAISAGKAALAKFPFLSSRKASGKGFFAELNQNDIVHPGWYSVHCVDGIGTKLYFCAWSGDYATQMQDGLQMVLNDMAPMMRAFPSELSVYIACQSDVEEHHMGDIMRGIGQGLERTRIPNAPFEVNLGKIETASLDEMIALGMPGKGVDLGFVLNGWIKKEDVPNLNPQPGYKIVGVASTGLHSNAYTGGRHSILAPSEALEAREEWRKHYGGRWHLDSRPAALEGATVMEAMMTPTADYLVDSIAIGRHFEIKDIFGINITGNGFKNFNRVGKGVSYEITDPLPALPVHRFLITESGWPTEKSYVKQNNGMGFAYIVPNQTDAEIVVDIINKRGVNHAEIVGEVRDIREVEKETGEDFGGELVTRIHKPYDGSGIVTLKGYQ
ncbi:MAG: hypothetical protein ABIE22_05330 [archaeon]